MTPETTAALEIDLEENAVHSKYLPEPASRRSGIALCLSGGGFRASLFHLGALQRLNELGVLSKVDTITSVSGGSILSAHIAERLRPWPAPGEAFAGWESRIAAPFRVFTSRDIRTGPILKRLLLPWNWLRSTTQVEALAARYEKNLTRLTLDGLAPAPKFVFCATDMTFGVNWIFERTRVGDYQTGYLKPAPAWTVGRAAAASSCFPPVFGPMSLCLEPNKFKDGNFPAGRERDKLVSRVRLTDGGVYDNMGLEPVWKSYQVVLVSDGGAPFTLEMGTNPVRRLRRYLAIVGNQSASVRKRWLVSNFLGNIMDGAYWGIASATRSYDSAFTQGYSKELAAEIISRIRTDLDAFVQAEKAVLINHGYLLADAAIRRHVPSLINSGAQALTIPYPEWMNEARLRSALRSSHSRFSLSRIARAFQEKQSGRL